MLMPSPTGPEPLPIPNSWHDPIRDWALALRAAGRSENTIYTRTDHLRRFARGHPEGPWVLTGSTLVGWCGQQQWRPEGRRSFYASLRNFYRWAVGVGHITVSPAERLPAVKPGQPRPRPTPERIYAAALDDADDRTGLILRLAGELGMRRGEIAQMHANDLVDDLLSTTLIAHGKGNKDRDLPMPPGLAAACRLRAGTGWLFPGDFNGHLSPRYVGKLATRVLPEGWGLHSLRHRFASLSNDLDHDLIGLCDTLGHASVATTQRYVRVSDEAKRRLVMSVASHRSASRAA
jgi:integrase